MTNPKVFRSVSRSPGTKKCAKGKTIKATPAIETPAKPEVTNCCPQLSSMNGMADDKAPMMMSLEKTCFPIGSANSLNPRKPQKAIINRVANPILAAANQKGVIPSKASSITIKVAPQIRPKAPTITQLCAVISGGFSFLVNALHPRDRTSRFS